MTTYLWEPAFPQPLIETRGGAFEQPEPAKAGMSLRDYFAGQALPKAIEHELALRATTIVPPPFRYDAIAKAAYVIADAMLAERAK